jgi:hypothetical protein
MIVTNNTAILTNKAAETRRANREISAEKAAIATAMIGARAVRDGNEVEIVGADTKSYAEPMCLVRFPDGSLGVLRPSEVAR